MTMEIVALYTSGFGTAPTKWEEASVPERPVTDQEVEQYTALLEAMGAKRHDTRDGFFYDQMTDSTHCTETIFRN